MAIKNYILICGGTACESVKAELIYQNLLSEAEALGVAVDVQVVKTGCFGFCEQGPIVKILPEQAFYVQVTPEDAKEIIAETVLKGRIIDRLQYKVEKSNIGDNLDMDNIDFYKKQYRVALRNCGFINPEDITEYIARDGYVALEKCLFEYSPERILEEIKTSGIRGRGGAGFPTWLKWKFTKEAAGDKKCVVCNADEGDPGAYMDRSTLEGDPHSVLEAMAIAGVCVGADRGYIYIRAEYPLAIERLQIAMGQAREYGLLGENILGSNFNFDIELRYGAGAFVCGEETALLASVEGERGTPRPKPPFPAIKGLFGMPSVINNVETFANIPIILTKGAEWFANIGTEGSKGTKVFALTGKIKNSGLVEVPMGTTLREIIFEIGGGIKDGKAFKAVQTGGPSGGMIPSKFLDTPIDFDTLTSIGSMMGSGGMIVLDEDDCVIDVCKFYMEFCVDESCGKCSPCRIGTKKLYGILDRISKGRGKEQDLQDIRDIGDSLRKASLCGLGQTAPNPVLSMLNYFEDELVEHIKDCRCRAGKCKDLISYKINSDKCIGCGLCATACPVNCITQLAEGTIAGKKKQPYEIEQSACIKCGECYNACPAKIQAVEIA